MNATKRWRGCDYDLCMSCRRRVANIEYALLELPSGCCQLEMAVVVWRGGIK